MWATSAPASPARSRRPRPPPGSCWPEAGTEDSGGLVRRGRLLRAPVDTQQRERAEAAGAECDAEAGPPPEVLQRAHVSVDAPLAGPEGPNDHAHRREHHDVPPALAGREDEEAVLAVVGDPRHE